MRIVLIGFFNVCIPVPWKESELSNTMRKLFHFIFCLTKNGCLNFLCMSQATTLMNKTALVKVTVLAQLPTGSTSSASQTRSLWFTILGEIFVYVTSSFNPTTEAVTFRLPGWCILDMFLLPAFIRLGHECHDLLSPCYGLHVCSD